MRNLSRAIIVLMTAIAAVVPAGGVASAHTIAYPTSLTLKVSPPGTVAHGQKVTFSGQLTSKKQGCVRNVTVRLTKIGGGTITTTTGRGGRFSFKRQVFQTHRWFVRFAGKVLNAVHPHNHTCKASVSPKVTVRVS